MARALQAQFGAAPRELTPEALAGAEPDLVIVLAPPKWTRALGRRGARRLDDPQDPFRQSLEVAADGAPMLIALIDAAAPPQPAELPQAVRALADAPTTPLRDGCAAADLDDLVAAAARLLGRPQIDADHAAAPSPGYATAPSRGNAVPPPPDGRGRVWAADLDWRRRGPRPSKADIDAHLARHGGVDGPRGRPLWRRSLSAAVLVLVLAAFILWAARA